MSCAYPAEIPIAGAITTAHRTDGGLAWDARWVVALDAVADFQGGRLSLVPLAQGESMQPARDVVPIVEDGRITGVCVAPGALDGRTIRASFVQPASHQLGAPIAASNAVQIIDAADSEDLTVEGPVEAHVGFFAARGIGHDAREEALRLTNAPQPIARTFVFVRGNDARGLGIHERAKTSALGPALAFALVIALLVFAATRLKRRASVERADAILAQEIEEASGRP